MRNRKPPTFRPAFAPTRAENDAARIAAWRAKKAVEEASQPRLSAAERGYDKDWFRLRARILRASPWCVACAAEGVERKAEVLDHIITIRERPDLRLEPTNLQPLCRSHHQRKTIRFDGGFGRPRK